MATSSSGPGSGSITDAVRADVPPDELSYGALVGRGLDIDAFLAEYFALTGVDGIRMVTLALGRTPIEVEPFEMVEGIGALESLKSCAGAVQAEITCAHVDAVTSDRTERGVRQKHPEWGIGADVAMARHESPRSGVEYVNFCQLLVSGLPFTLQGLKYGVINAAEAQVIYRETRHLDPAARAEIDARLFTDVHTCFGLGGKKLGSMVRHWALAYGSENETDLAAKAMKDRYVNIYPLDAHRMKLVGILPTEYGVAIAQVLARETGRAQAAGDGRNCAQVAADTVLEGLTGVSDPASFPVQLAVVMTDRTLFQGHPEPAYLQGYGIISAQKARELFAGNPANPLDSWVRRLYTAPGTGDLVAMDQKTRLFSGGLKQFINVRDQFCRTPYCGGRIQHLDHVVQSARGGATRAENASSRCAWCNATKEAPGWEESPIPGDRHTLRVTTSSRHVHTSTAPRMPGTDHYPVRPVSPPPPRRRQ